MTSKEALYLLMTNQKKVRDGFKFINLNTHEKVSIEECYDIVIKDLEVLEIIKNNEISISYIEQSTSYDDYISKCDCFRNLSYIAEEEYTKLKEWLENDKKRVFKKRVFRE